MRANWMCRDTALTRGDRRTDPIWWALALGACAALLLFEQIFGLSILLASAPVWRNPPNDMVQMMSGIVTIMREPWHFPPTVTNSLISPDAVSIVYTDSIPWMTLALKATRLGSWLNPLGCFLLLSTVLQAVGGICLLRVAGCRSLPILVLGSLLFLLFPAWIVRQLGHVALAGQWLLLLAATLSIATARHGLKPLHAIGFAALGALATGIHAYHLVPIGFCLAAAMTSELVRGRVWPAALAGLLFIAAVGSSAFVLGYGTGQGLSTGGAILGFYSMNLAGPFLPQASTLFGQTWDGAWFTGTIDPTGGQKFEGYNYLGAGIIFLLALATVCLLRARHRWRRSTIMSVAPLAGWLLILTVLAIGPDVYFGDLGLLHIAKPTGRLGDAIGLFRAHGRFFWIIGYVALAASLVIVERRLGRRTGVIACLLAITVQGVDVRRLQAQVSDRYQGPDQTYYPPALADLPELRGRAWNFVPSYFCSSDALDQITIAQLSYLAVRTGGSSNASPTARQPNRSCEAPAGLMHDAAPDDLRLTVILDGGMRFGGAYAAFHRREDCTAFSRGLLCGRNLPVTADLFAFADDRFVLPWPGSGRAVRFEHDSPGPRLLATGWAPPGASGTVSNGAASDICFALPTGRPPGPVAVAIEAEAEALPGEDAVSVGLSADGRALTSWTIRAAEWRTYEVTLPPPAGPAPVATCLELSIPTTTPGGRTVQIRKMTVAW